MDLWVYQTERENKAQQMIFSCQITALRKNVDAEGNMLYDNYRPTQDINSRTVYHHATGDALVGGGGKCETSSF